MKCNGITSFMEFIFHVYTKFTNIYTTPTTMPHYITSPLCTLPTTSLNKHLLDITVVLAHITYCYLNSHLHATVLIVSCTKPLTRVSTLRLHHVCCTPKLTHITSSPLTKPTHYSHDQLSVTAQIFPIYNPAI